MLKIHQLRDARILGEDGKSQYVDFNWTVWKFWIGGSFYKAGFYVHLTKTGIKIPPSFDLLYLQAKIAKIPHRPFDQNSE